MSAADVETAFSSISAQKDDLKKSFEDLQSCSSSFASFTLQWKDIDDYLSFTEKTARKRFQELQASDKLLEKEKPAASTSLPAVVAREDKFNPEVDPRPGLKLPCISMDAKSLRLCIADIHEDVEAIRRELGRALLLAPDPVTLVLDFSEEFNSSKKIRNAFLALLECLHDLAPEIKPLDKERARTAAEKCKVLFTNGKKKDKLINVLIFLNLIAMFGLVEFLVVEDVFGLLLLVAEMNRTVDLCRNPLFEAKVPDLIQKLNKVGRQLDALKFVIAFNLLDKYPVDCMFKAYINQLKKSSDQRTMGRTPNCKIKAITKQICGLQTVIKAVEKYNLESLYPCNNLQRQINDLETQRYNIRGGFVRNEHSKWNSTGKEQRHQRPIKRPRPSSDPVQPQPPNQPQLGLADRAPFILANPYGLNSAPPFYVHDGASLPVNPFGIGGPGFPQNPYPYAADAPAGPAHHDMMMAYGGYPNPGFPFDPSHHHP